MGYHCAYDVSTNYVIVFYQGGTSSVKTYVQPLYHNTSDGTYTLGTANELHSSGLSNHRSCIVYDPDTERTVIGYADYSNSFYQTANVVQSTGTSGSPTVTIGSDVLLNGTASVDECDVVYDTTNNKVVMFFDDDDVDIVKGSIGTVTGGGTNSISFTSPTTIWDPSANPNYWSTAYNSSTNKIFLFYADEDSGDDFTYKTITPTASSLTVADGEVISANLNKMQGGSASGGGSKGVICATQDSGNSSKVSFGILYNLNVTSTTINASQFVGTARSSTDLELAEPPTELVGKANGSITKGKPVIVRTDGDFEQVQNTTASGSFSKGTETSLNGSSNDRYGFLNYNILRDKFLFQVRDSSSSTLVGMAVTVSNNTVTVGTSSSSPLTSITSSNVGNTSYFDELTGYHAVFGKNASNLEGVTAEITSSGSVTWGSKDTMHFTIFDQMCSNYVNDDNVGLIFYTRSGETKCRSITTTAGTIADVSSVTIDSNSSLEGMSWAYSTKDNKTVLVRQDNGSSNYLSYSVVTSSGTGTTLSTSTPTIFISASDKVSNQALGYDITNDKFLLVYRQNANNKLTLRVGTLSGTTVTWGSATTLSGDPITTAFDQALSYNKYASKFIVNYVDDSNSMYTTAFEVTLDSSGTITVENKTVLYSYWGYDNSSASSTISAQNLISTYNSSNYSKGIGVSSSYSVENPNLTANNFIGFAQGTVADNEDVKVAITGQTDDNQSSLTTASEY